MKIKRSGRPLPKNLKARETALVESLLGSDARDLSEGTVFFLADFDGTKLPPVEMEQGDLLAHLQTIGAPLPSDWVAELNATRADGCTPVLTCVDGCCNVYGVELVTVAVAGGTH